MTRILNRIEGGDPAAAEQLLPLVYEHLKRFATAKMADERSDHTLQATALVHEAYLRLVDTSHPDAWKSRAHFFGAAAEAMRRILVEWARKKATQKRGGGAVREPLDDAQDQSAVPIDELLDVHDALDHLATEDRQTAELIKLRYFAGLNMQETAEVLGISVRKAHYVWDYGRTWLRRELRDN